MKILKPVLLIAAGLFALTYAVNEFPAQYLFDAAKALALLFIVYLIGFLTLNLGRKTVRSRDFIDYVGTGLVVTTFYFFFASSLQALNLFSLILYFASPVALAAFIFRNKGLREQFLLDSEKIWRRGSLEWMVFFLPFLYAALPTTFFDSLVYTIGLPNFFLQNGGFVKTPQFMFANGFIYYETSLIPAVFLGDAIPRLLHFFLGMFFILALLDHGCREFRLKKRHILLLTILSMPLTLFLLTTEKADLITALFIFLAIKKYFDDEPRLSAVFWGFAIGTKSFSVIAAAVFFILMVLLNKRLQLKKHLAMLGIMIITILPLLVKNGFCAGNPFFPFLSRFFPNPYWDASRLQPVVTEVGTRFSSLRDLLQAPYSFSFRTQGAGGMVGPAFLIFLPLLLLGKIEKDKRIFLYFPLLLLLVSSFFGNAFRYIYVVFVLLAMIVAAVCEKQDRRFLKLVFTAVILTNFATGFFTLEGIYEARQVYFEKTAAAEYIAARFPMYRVYQLINARTDPAERILVTGETRGYYLKRPYRIASAHDYSILKKYVNAAANAADFVSAIKADGFAYLVFNLDEFSRLASYRPLSQEETKKLFRLLGELKPVLKESSIYLFKL
jgi:hypothetical protein